MELIKQLREITGAGIVDCQKALQEAEQNLDKAIEILRKKGIAKAAKRGDRATNEGIVRLFKNEAGNKAFAFILSSETDFVSRNEKFQDFAKELEALILKEEPENLEELLTLEFKEASVKEDLALLSGVIGEQMELKDYKYLTAPSLAGYSHLGEKLGVLLALDQPGLEDLALELAMQVAATNPKYISPSEVGQEEIEKEKEIYKEQLIKEGKPELILDKIVEGKINKYFEEICLIEQEYIKDDKKKVKELLAGAKVLAFWRLSL